MRKNRSRRLIQILPELLVIALVSAPFIVVFALVAALSPSSATVVKDPALAEKKAIVQVDALNEAASHELENKLHVEVSPSCAKVGASELIVSDGDILTCSVDSVGVSDEAEFNFLVESTKDSVSVKLLQRNMKH